MSTWTRGTGQYEQDVYVVKDVEGKVVLTLARGAHIGHGSYARQIGTEGDLLVLPEHTVAGTTLPRVTLRHDMVGFWEISSDRTLVFSEDLPQGATREGPDTPAALITALLKLLSRFTIVSGARRAVIFMERRGFACPPVMYAPDPTAPEGTTSQWLAEVLNVPYANAVITALRKRAIGTAADVDFMPEVMGRHIALDTAATNWWWTTPDGSSGKICDYRRGDHTIDLPAMLRADLAVPLALNSVSGEMVETIGLTVLSHVAYPGREGNSLHFLVPCELSETRTIHAVVRHEHGLMVYGFSVARRSDARAETEARGAGENPLKALTRRPIKFQQQADHHCYFVFPGGERVVRITWVPPS